MAVVEGFPRPGADDAAGFGLTVRAGEVVLITGPNGSGKTSLLRALAGLTSARTPRRIEAPEAIQLMTQDARDGLVGLTVTGEFRIRGLPPPELGPLRHQEVATLSSGEARRVAFEVVRAAQPALLILDEPAEGLDDHALANLLAAVHDTAARGGAVIAADHSGTFSEVATRTIALAPEPEVTLAQIPSHDGPTVVASPATELRLGTTTVRLPPVRLGPGFHLLTGPNGSGKSTLLLRLAGLTASKGVLVHGSSPRPGVDTRLLLPHARDLLMRATVADELHGAEGPALELVPPDLKARHPLTLSGGEAQRVALAKTLGRAAPLYLLDEPDAHLDAAAWPILRDAIAHRVAQGSCVLAASHDRRLIALAHTTLRMGAA